MIIQIDGTNTINKGAELMLYAIVHRDYNGNSFLTVKIFDNALEIWNEGELLEPLTVDALKTNHLSRLRNRKMADIFYRSGAIESWGCGTLKILDIAKEGGYPAPDFEEFMGGFMARFPRKIFENEDQKDGVKDILLLIEKNLAITTKELSQQLDIPFRTMQRYMEKLKKDRIIDRIDGRKNGYWKITKNEFQTTTAGKYRSGK